VFADHCYKSHPEQQIELHNGVCIIKPVHLVLVLVSSFCQQVKFGRGVGIWLHRMTGFTYHEIFFVGTNNRVKSQS